MVLITLPRRTPAETQPAQQTPARRRLHEHIQQQARQHERLNELAQACREAGADAAAERMAAAQRTLDSITEAESAALASWAATPTESMPALRTQEREAALGELAQATHAHETAARAAAAITTQFRADEQRLHDLHKQLPDLVDAVVIEEAQRLALRWHQARREAAACNGAIDGLYGALMRAGRTATASRVGLGFVGTPLPDVPTLRVEQHNHDAAVGLRDRLSRDAAATVEIDPALPAPRGATA